MAEFVDSFEVLSQVGPGVTVFGSARMQPSKSLLSGGGGTGQGTGQKQSGDYYWWWSWNHGSGEPRAYSVKGKSVGLNIELRTSKRHRFANVPINFHYFFRAKFVLVK